MVLVTIFVSSCGSDEESVNDEPVLDKTDYYGIEISVGEKYTETVSSDILEEYRYYTFTPLVGGDYDLLVEATERVYIRLYEKRGDMSDVFEGEFNYSASESETRTLGSLEANHSYFLVISTDWKKGEEAFDVTISLTVQ